ncbi:MAG: tRNA (adenosine(37)-N6)-threonylcarbamoyltransferase complex ATPase subunit type 1 TsaE [Candidatus Vogelbacteria bacterium]|nr:tRNA (adenosine(37)-N6)-threonylcarbamoyltransferase complex ATPase subunit type 1 TsaE [Candidatus Vogelbacteria bacterium]
MKYITHNLKETYDLAAKFVAELLCDRRGGNRATVVALFGELGTGKTSFTQGIAKAFEIKDHITSPTFVLEKVYKLGKKFSYERFTHIDAYRLNGGEEMRALGWDEASRDPKNIIFIEWPERVESVLPRDMIKIYFEHSEKEGERKIKILC